MRIIYLLWAGIIAAPVLWGAIVLFASLQPNYSYSLNSVSELGATTSKYYTAMNIFGFMLAGLLVVLGSLGAYLTAKELKKNALFSLPIATFGLMFIGVAFPMDTHLEAHRFFAHGMLIPLYLSMFLLMLFMWHWKVSVLYKTCFYTFILVMLVLQIIDVSGQYLVMLQKIKILIIFMMYSTVFLSLNSSLKQQ